MMPLWSSDDDVRMFLRCCHFYPGNCPFMEVFEKISYTPPTKWYTPALSLQVLTYSGLLRSLAFITRVMAQFKCLMSLILSD